jgi:outer membrane biosynthesis protein TonB
MDSLPASFIPDVEAPVRRMRGRPPGPETPPSETAASPARVAKDDPAPSQVAKDDPAPSQVEKDDPAPSQVEKDDPAPSQVEKDDPAPSQVEEDPAASRVEEDDPARVASPADSAPDTAATAPPLLSETRPDSENGDDIVVYETGDIEKMSTLKELRAMCQERSLSDKGKKSELAARIRQHDGAADVRS